MQCNFNAFGTNTGEAKRYCTRLNTIIYVSCPIGNLAWLLNGTF